LVDDASTIPETAILLGRFQEFDWAATELGPLGTWPPSLKSAAGLVLHAAVPMFLLWGQDALMIYNGAYAEIAGIEALGELGRKAGDLWPDMAEFREHVLKTVLAGGTLAYRDQEFTFDRHGVRETIWVNLDYSPILGEAGRPAGVLAIMVETTQTVLAQRRLAQMFEQGPTFMALLDGPAHRFEVVNASYLKLIGRRDVLGKTVAEALPDAVAQGYLQTLDQVFQTGQPFSGIGAKYLVEPVAGGPVTERFVDFIYQPITDPHGAVTGIFVEGVDVTARMAAETALVEWNASLEQRIAERTEQLAAKETLIAKFFEHSSECYAIFTRDPAGAFRYEEVNPATLEIYQLTREQVIGHTLAELLEPAAAEIIGANLAACLADGQPRRYQRRHGEIVLEAVATPVPGEAGGAPRVLVSAHDATAQAAKAAALVAANKQLGEMATTDALTQINNRRGFDEALAREWSRARRLGTGIALLLFDIDEFKSFNDHYGHLKGDECLQQIAACLRDNLGRAADFVARYGGEEFAVLLVDIQAEHNGALIVAERLRQAVEDLAIPHPASALGYVTISGGVATAWPQPALRGSIEAISISIIREADAALYTAKYAGRNRVHGQVAAPRPEPPKPRTPPAPPPARRGRGRPRGTGRKMSTPFSTVDA